MPRHLPGEGYPAPHCTEDELRRINVPTGPAPGAPRRVRTQVERDADGTAWRNRYATVDDIQRAMKLIAASPPPPSQCRMHPTAARWMAARASVKPRVLGGPSPAFLGIPIIEDPDLPYGEWRLLDADGRVVKRGRFDQPPGPETGTTPRPPRRRWWHRYTRRAR